MRRALILAVVIVVIIAGVVAYRVTNRPQTDGPMVVSVAANLPMTGALAVYGTEIRDGAELARSELDGPDDSVDLRIDWQDNASEPRTAVTIAQQQLLAEPNIYISGVKPQSMAVAPLVQQRGIPHFLWIFDAFINKDNPKHNNLRTWVGYHLEPAIYLDYARRRKASRIAIAYAQLPHCEEEFNAIVAPELRKLSTFDDLLMIPFPYTKSDFKDVAAEFEKFSPDLMILSGFQESLVGQIRALRVLDLIKDGNAIGTYDLMDAAAVLGPAELEGLHAVAPRYLLDPSEQAKAFESSFNDRYGRAPLYTAAYAYDMVAAILDAAQRIGGDRTPEGWLAAIHATDTTGVTGPIRFTDDGDVETELVTAVFHDGKMELGE